MMKKQTIEVSVPDIMRGNVLLYFADKGQAWLENLRATVEQVSRDWFLHVHKPFPNLSVNYVAPVTCPDGTSAVLKIGVPCREIDSEIAALSHFDGNGAVKLLKSDPTNGLLLLERVVPGTVLVESSDSFEAIEIAARLMSTLWKPLPENHPFPTVANWFEGLAELRKKFDGSTGPLPQKLFEMAESLSADLIASTEEVYLLHGDCHHQNIVSSDMHGWIVIDPKGVAGDRCYELCSYLRNPLDLHESFDISVDLPRRVDKFAEILGFDRKRIASWGLAEALLSSSWAIDSEPEGWGKNIALAEVYAKML